MASASMLTVAVMDARVMADIGVFSDEIGRKQELAVDVVLSIRPVAEDRLERTIDYRDVLKAIESGATQRTGLIEIFAQRLADAFRHRDCVCAAKVTVRKPGALSNGVATVCVELARDRP